MGPKMREKLYLEEHLHTSYNMVSQGLMSPEIRAFNKLDRENNAKKLWIDLGVPLAQIYHIRKDPLRHLSHFLHLLSDFDQGIQVSYISIIHFVAAKAQSYSVETP